jgi:hypothetical protein
LVFQFHGEQMNLIESHVLDESLVDDRYFLEQP